MLCSSQPFLSAAKPNLHTQDISHGLGGFFLCRGGDMGIGVQGVFTFYGQEIDLTTYNLCRINMFLHNIEFDKFSTVREDGAPQFSISRWRFRTCYFVNPFFGKIMQNFQISYSNFQIFVIYLQCILYIWEFPE